MSEMNVCVDCGKPLTGCAANRERCDECADRRRRAYSSEYSKIRRMRMREEKVEKPIVLRYCMDCGVQLPIGCCSRQKRCEVCGKVRKKEMARLWVARRKAEEEKKAKQKASLGAVAREAAEHGMSYGQWVSAINRNGG